MSKGGGVTPHPSIKPTAPRKPPCDRYGQGSRSSGEAAPYGAKHEFGGYDHSKEMHSNHYGHAKRLKGHATHKSEFEGGGHFAKAGDQKGDDEPG